mmetsp:Transcript_15531/g.33496  ORF Transcript_15531/g.33496 Transcript_15531/m.33496 type:complete len:225 (-) Transcript_15531:574-1248(-)
MLRNAHVVRVRSHSKKHRVDSADVSDDAPIKVDAFGEVAQKAAPVFLHFGRRPVRIHQLDGSLDTTIPTGGRLVRHIVKRRVVQRLENMLQRALRVLELPHSFDHHLDSSSIPDAVTVHVRKAKEAEGLASGEQHTLVCVVSLHGHKNRFDPALVSDCLLARLVLLAQVGQDTDRHFLQRRTVCVRLHGLKSHSNASRRSHSVLSFCPIGRHVRQRLTTLALHI